nr:retrovirus-related Pol polyprotein [Tanacetum cinerariifolium]
MVKEGIVLGHKISKKGIKVDKAKIEVILKLPHPTVRNKMHKAFPLLRESSHWQYKFPLLVEGVPTARRMKIPLP